MELKRGIEKAVAAVVKHLEGQKEEVGNNFEKIRQVGRISANGDETIGNLIAEAMEKVGIEGVITVEEAKGTETEVKTVGGMQFDRGYISPYFVTDSEKMICEFENPYILLYDKKIFFYEGITSGSGTGSTIRSCLVDHRPRMSKAKHWLLWWSTV